MICKDRYKLLQQSLDTLLAHTDPKSYTLTLIDDASQDFRTQRVFDSMLSMFRGRARLVRFSQSVSIIAQLRNAGAAISAELFGKGEYLYFSDSDVYFTDGWLKTLIDLANRSRPNMYRLWGGQAHPFHQSVLTDIDIYEVEVLDGPSWLLSWDTWSLLHFDRLSAPGPCQSEEYPICNFLRQQHYRIGVANPHVVYHTGLTNSDGEPAPGWAERKLLIPRGVYCE